jgi:hypothetical protein
MAADCRAGWAASRKIRSLVSLAVLGVWTGLGAGASAEPRFAVLVFSKTTGFRHDSIPQGIAAIGALGAEHGFSVDSPEDAGRFTMAELARFRVVVFLCMTGDILDPGQKAAFEGFVVVVGIPAARWVATTRSRGVRRSTAAAAGTPPWAIRWKAMPSLCSGFICWAGSNPRQALVAPGVSLRYRMHQKY